MDTPKKEFILRFSFYDAKNTITNGGACCIEEKHYGVTWRMAIIIEAGQLSFFLITDIREDENKSVQVEYTLKLLADSKNISTSSNHCFGKSETGFTTSLSWAQFMSWAHLEKDFQVSGNLVVEAHMRIGKMIGFQDEKLRNFDESTKKFSDVVLEVDTEKFHVSKLFLSSQSVYFEKLLLGNFKESEKSEVKLHDIDVNDFQKFLEVLHGEFAINENSVDGILLLADMYDAQFAIRKCEEFLLEKSQRGLKVKLQLSTRYGMEILRETCVNQLNSIAHIRNVTPPDPMEMDPLVMASLFQKVLNIAKSHGL